MYSISETKRLDRNNRKFYSKEKWNENVENIMRFLWTQVFVSSSQKKYFKKKQTEQKKERKKEIDKERFMWRQIEKERKK